MSLHSDLIAAGLPVSGTAVEGQRVFWTRDLTPQEAATAESIINPLAYNQAQAVVDAAAVPTWATITQAGFDTWCNANLLTDGQIDALTLATGLKTNIKAINFFVRNAGKILIALRNWTRILG